MKISLGSKRREINEQNIFQLDILRQLSIGLILIACFVSCVTKSHSDTISAKVRSDIRTSSIFYSIIVLQDDRCYAIRGVPETSYKEVLKVKSADTSEIFIPDSLTAFMKNITQISKEPVQGRKALDSPRIEVYSNGLKIYDVESMDGKFWQLFNPIMTQIPKCYNPFLVTSDLHF